MVLCTQQVRTITANNAAVFLHYILVLCLWRNPSRGTDSSLTHTVLLFSVVWLWTIKGSDAFCSFPEWTSAIGAPSARSKRFPVATSVRQDKQISFSQKIFNLHTTLLSVFYTLSVLIISVMITVLWLSCTPHHRDEATDCHIFLSEHGITSGLSILTSVTPLICNGIGF